MDGGFDSIQILVVVLVVLAQGAGALRAWFRKLKQRREEEEARTGLPGNRGVYGSTEPAAKDQPASAELPDWDPFEDDEEEEYVPEAPAPRRSEPQTHPAGDAPSRMPSATPIVAAERIQPKDSPALARLPGQVPSYKKRVDTKLVPTKLPGGISLRNAILTKEILDRPLSARRLGGTAARP